MTVTKHKTVVSSFSALVIVWLFWCMKTKCSFISCTGFYSTISYFGHCAGYSLTFMLQQTLVSSFTVLVTAWPLWCNKHWFLHLLCWLQLDLYDATNTGFFIYCAGYSLTFMLQQTLVSSFTVLVTAWPLCCNKHWFLHLLCWLQLYLYAATNTGFFAHCASHSMAATMQFCCTWETLVSSFTVLVTAWPLWCNKHWFLHLLCWLQHGRYSIIRAALPSV